MKHTLLTISQAAKLTGVSRTAIYNAIAQKRLPYGHALGRLVVKEKDILAAQLGSAKRGRPAGQPISKKHKRAIGEAQRERWSRIKSQDIG